MTPEPQQPPRITPDPFMAKLLEMMGPSGITDLQKSWDQFTNDARAMLALVTVVKELTVTMKETNRALKDLSEALK